MTKSVFLLGIVLLSSISSAQDATPKTMLKLEVRLQSPDAPTGSFASLPKVMYRSGTRHCRVEEAADPQNNIHGLLITNEPDAWVVNLATSAAQHFVDQGPTFNCRLPIFSDEDAVSAKDSSLRILALEFGGELAYFKSKGAIPKPGPVLQTKQTISYEVQVGPTTLKLFTYGPQEFPLAVSRQRGDKLETFWYSGYGPLPFDPKLFAKPERIKIAEQKP